MSISYLHNFWERQSIMDKNLFENKIKEYIEDKHEKLGEQPLISKWFETREAVFFLLKPTFFSKLFWKNQLNFEIYVKYIFRYFVSMKCLNWWKILYLSFKHIFYLLSGIHNKCSFIMNISTLVQFLPSVNKSLRIN